MRTYAVILVPAILNDDLSEIYSIGTWLDEGSERDWLYRISAKRQWQQREEFILYLMLYKVSADRL